MSKPLFVLSFDVDQRVQGYVVVDSLAKGTSSGGVRIVPDLEQNEVRMLAAEMTLKYAFAGLPRGGAKCGIRMPSDVSGEERLHALEEVGRCLAAIIKGGIYYPGMDMNCGPEELRAIYRGAGITLGELTDTSFYTAVFVAEAIRAAASVLFAHEAGPLTLAIEGFGAVANHLAAMLEPDRFRIVALSTVRGAIHNPEGFDENRLRELRAAHGDALVDHLEGERLEQKEALLALSVDILVPAARVGSVDAQNMATVSARCVVPAANAPCTQEALDHLHGRGIPVLPGFVCNAGGVLGSSLFDRGVTQENVGRLAAGPFRMAVEAVLRRSIELGLQPSELARRIAMSYLKIAQTKIVGRSDRLLKRLSRTYKPVMYLLNRHAVQDCSTHFSFVSGVAAHLEAPLKDFEMEDPSVSIIMPVHGTEKFLAQAVQSVLDQTFDDFELIVLDDESPGDPAGVLAAFHDPRIRYLRHDNRGPAYTRNRGVRESRGRYIAFLDSDDAWVPDKLAKQVEVFRTRRDVDVVYTQRITMDEDGAETDGFRPRLHGGFILQEIYVDNCICMSSAMLRREVFNIVGFIDENLRMSEDFDFWLRVAAGHRFEAIGEPLVRYRVHSGQVSRDVGERVRVVWEIRKDFDKVHGHLVSAKARNRARALHHCGKGSRASSAGQRLISIAPHYLRALWHFPKYVPAWKELCKLMLPTRIQSMFRRNVRKKR